MNTTTTTARTRTRFVLTGVAIATVLIILISWLAYEFIRSGVHPTETWPLIRLILQGLYVVIVWGTFEMLRPPHGPRVP